MLRYDVLEENKQSMHVGDFCQMMVQVSMGVSGSLPHSDHEPGYALTL